MDSPDRIESPRPSSRWRGYAWGVLAALTCPCHLPILAAVLAGTTAGAFIGDHWGVAAVALAGLFFLSLARAIRAFRGSA
jgi:mercuric ion transport protein